MSLSNRLFSEAFRDMQRVVSALEQPVLNNMAPLLANRAGNSFLRFPAADLVETPKGYELHAELPGFDKNNIKIEMPDSRTLILSGSVNEQHESRSDPTSETTTNTDTTTDKKTKSAEEDKQVATTDNKDNKVGEHKSHYWVNERVSGAFSRSFRFPTPVNTEDIKASFKDGVLKVAVPKSAQEQPKQVNID